MLLLFLSASFFATLFHSTFLSKRGNDVVGGAGDVGVVDLLLSCVVVVVTVVVLAVVIVVLFALDLVLILVLVLVLCAGIADLADVGEKSISARRIGSGEARMFCCGITMSYTSFHIIVSYLVSF